VQIRKAEELTARALKGSAFEIGLIIVIGQT
jgi:hypothetical protein